MSWYSSRWRRNNNATTPLPTVAPTSPLASATGGAAPNTANPAGPQAGFAHLLPQTNASDPTGATRADRKTLEPLFGPNIGAVSSGPAWTGYVDRDKKVLGGGYSGLSSPDELTPEVINGWVEKSKDPTQPTTTLQALVNLKRPSLRLVPLSAPSYASDATSTAPPQQHALEFTYDADAPKVSIRVHVYLPRGHPDLGAGGTVSSPAALTASPNSALGAGGAPSTFASPLTATSPSATGSSHPYAKLLVFETVTEGGFGRKLKIGDGAVVELGRFEKVPAKRTGGAPEDERLNDEATRLGVASGQLPLETPASATAESAAGGLRPDAAGGAANSRRSRRFTRAFRLITPHRHRDQEQELRAAGPALAVVDVNAQPEDGAAPAVANPANPAAAPTKKEEEHGVKLTIRLVALDEQGAEMGCPNEQVTYLHVVRVGTKPTPTPKAPATAAGGNAAASGTQAEAEAAKEAASPANAAEGQQQPEETTEEEEDTRPWVVKVVKREATIGPHTFHLHEIFGLTNSASDGAEPAPAPVPVQGHTYPPTGAPIGNDTPDDPSPSEECLLCLSSPREVVLLPCRHLVACKDCALNMVEFGAGGAINQGSETQAAATATIAPTGGAAADGRADGAAAATEGGGGGVATNIVNAMNTRRKRKAKGWFCPVCRQPYTSLLRLTTQPPPPAATGVPPTSAAAAEGTQAATNDEANAEGSGNTGILGSLRPSFFRSLTSGKGVAENASNANTAAGGASSVAAGGSAAAGGARTSGVTEDGEEMVQVNARAGDVESTGGLGRPGA